MAIMPTTVELLTLGRQARARACQDEARDHFEAALSQSRRDQEPVLEIEALKGLGQVARDLGDLERARECYEEAATLCENSDHPLLLAHTIRHVGDICVEQGQLTPARVACQRALEIYRSQPGVSPLDLANALRSMALVTERIDGPGSARPIWEEASDLYKALGIAAGVDECSSHLGDGA